MKSKPRILSRAVALLLLVASVQPAAVLAFTLTTFPAANWGQSDAALGISGYTIGDFEDATLQPGLLIEWSDMSLQASPPVRF